MNVMLILYWHCHGGTAMPAAHWTGDLVFKNAMIVLIHLFFLQNSPEVRSVQALFLAHSESRTIQYG